MHLKVSYVLGPMLNNWQKIEESTHSKTDRVKINLCQIKERTEQSIAIH